MRRDRLDNERIALILALTLRSDSSCIDVGAHDGTFLSDIVRLAPQGHHVAYEPLPAFAERLTRAFPDVDVRQAACGATPGRASFNHVTTVPAMSGLRPRDYGGAVNTVLLDVRVESLDEALGPDFVPTLIKIDVEGGELGVLQGAARMLAAHRPTVIFEHGKGASEFYGTTSADVHALLTSVGLRVFDLDGIGPYSAARLTEEFERNERWNWVAH